MAILFEIRHQARKKKKKKKKKKKLEELVSMRPFRRPSCSGFC
jgi:hypothetical protein